MAIFGVSISITGIIQLMLIKEFSLNLIEAGIFLSVHALGLVIFIIVGGLIAEKIGKKILICLALLGLLLADLIFANTYNIWVLFVTIFFIGGFGGIIESIVSALIVEINPKSINQHINRSQIYLTIGAILGLLIIGIIIVLGFNWRLTYYIIGLLAFICFMWLVLTNYKDNSTIRKAKRNYRKYFQDKIFILICFSLFLYTGTEVTIFGWLATFMNKGIGFTVANSIFITILMYISLTIGRIICGRCERKVQVSTMTIYLAFFSALVILPLGLIDSVVLIYSSIILTGMSFSSLYPFILAIGGKRMNDTFSISVIVVSGSVGAVIIPTITGIVANWTSLNFAISATSLFMIILTLNLFVIRRSSNSSNEARIRS
jgi:DHA1 family quinolone resistance protein-like MFS transporter